MHVIQQFCWVWGTPKYDACFFLHVLLHLHSALFLPFSPYMVLFFILSTIILTCVRSYVWILSLSFVETSISLEMISSFDIGMELGDRRRAWDIYAHKRVKHIIIFVCLQFFWRIEKNVLSFFQRFNKRMRRTVRKGVREWKRGRKNHHVVLKIMNFFFLSVQSICNSHTRPSFCMHSVIKCSFLHIAYTIWTHITYDNVRKVKKKIKFFCN